MDPVAFLDDLERKPAALGRLAGMLATADPWHTVTDDVDRVLLLGMGSSTYAAGVVAARLRSRGLDAVAELASSELLPPADPRTLVVAVSASGASRETLDAARRYAGRSPLVALTERAGSPLTALADTTVLLDAGPEAGGVACRSYQHTLVQLLALEHRLTDGIPGLLDTVHEAAEACDDLLRSRREWLAPATDLLAGPDGTWAVAPARRLGNALQSALMLREGPRLPASGGESAEWSHVDVYLTKTLDYRLLLLPGSAYEDELLRWTVERRSTVVAVGADVADAALCVRYAHDDSDDVRLLTEVLVAELVAQRLWERSPG